jgi:O-antigen ligase
MLLISGKSLDQWLGVTGGSRESGGILDPLFLSLLLVVGIVILFQRQLDWARMRSENAWLLLLLSYMLVSSIWADDTFISLKRWIRELDAVVMAFLIVTERYPREAMQTMLRRTVYVLIPYSVLLIKYYPWLGVQYAQKGGLMWVGVTLQKNGLGRLCLIAGFFLLWTFIRRWKKRDRAAVKHQTFAELIVVAMTIWLFRGPSEWAASATATASLAIGVIVYLVLLWMGKHRMNLGPNTWAIIVVCIIGIGVATPFVGGSTVTGFTSMLGRDSSLTGRTDIWAGLLPFVEQRPVLGSGYGVLWTPKVIAAATGLAEAHSGYLEVILQLGFVGLFLTVMFLASSARKAAILLAWDYDWGSLILCYLIMAAVHNITESSFDSLTRQLMALVVFLSAMSATAISSWRNESESQALESLESVRPPEVMYRS